MNLFCSDAFFIQTLKLNYFEGDFYPMSMDDSDVPSIEVEADVPNEEHDMGFEFLSAAVGAVIDLDEDQPSLEMGSEESECMEVLEGEEDEDSDEIVDPDQSQCRKIWGEAPM